MSHVTCHVSRDTCHVSHVLSFFFCGQSGEVYWWRVCFQRGLPRLVYNIKGISFYVLFRTIPMLKSAQNTPKESNSTQKKVQTNYFKVPKMPKKSVFCLHF